MYLSDAFTNISNKFFCMDLMVVDILESLPVPKLSNPPTNVLE
jgi:hypothetical protein